MDHLHYFAHWLALFVPYFLLISLVASVVVLLGCAVAANTSPSEEKDCMFHRFVA
jgi:hypothetical protein